MVKKLLLLLFLALSLNGFSQTVTQNYIDSNRVKAVALMNEHHIPASIILAVAIHESASGTSKIARYMNNHFGLKGPNSNTEIRSAYRDYETIDGSYDGFMDMMLTKAKYSVLFDKYSEYDYYNWAKGIQRGGYAASRTWASQIISLIRRYNLYEFDNRPEGYVEPPIRVSQVISKTYTVKKGDTLGEIARKFNTSTKVLINKNKLKSSVLTIGKKLKI